jgi:conjugal transfer pilus assembly protein TraB
MNDNTKNQQWLTLGIIATVLLLVIGFVLYLIYPSPSLPKTNQDSARVSFDSPVNNLDTQDYWLERTQNQINSEMNVNKTLSQKVDMLSQVTQNKDKTLAAQNAKIDALEQEVKTLQTNQLQAQAVQQSTGKSETSSQGYFPAQGESAQPQNGETGSMQDDAVQLKPKQNEPAILIPVKNPDTYVPAGTYVRAVMLGGADASAGVSNQNNPSPTLFRLLDNGMLPNKAKSHLKGCVATAAAIGDISSERGEIRLERLSCTRKDTSILDVPVEATVFGYDGKNGMRGQPLWREGPLLARAFGAGLLSGIGNGVAQAYTNTSLTPLAPVQTIDNQHILEYGLANGVSNAAEKLADYNIRRAEQYHPVIQVSAGQVVDIVFLKGFYLDGLNHDDEEEKSPYTAVTADNSPLTAILNSGANSNPNDPHPTNLRALPLTPEAINRLSSLTQKGVPAS